MYIIQTILNFLMWFAAVSLFWYIGSLIHIHRWNKWKTYLIKGRFPQTRQYRTCKGCEKVDDELVSYGVIEPIFSKDYDTIKDVKWNEEKKIYE